MEKIPPGCEIPPAAIAERVRLALLDDADAAALALGTGVDTLMRTAAGLPIRVATLAMIRGRLGRLGGCR
jgi:hypothetical protein